MSGQKREAVEKAIKRLTACYSPPESADPAAFLDELKEALSTLDDALITQGISDLIKTRRHKTFPSIGDVRGFCLDAAPKAYQAPRVQPLPYSVTDEGKQASAIAILAGFDRISDIISDGKIGVLYDFVFSHGRLPVDRFEWQGLRDTHNRVQATLRDAFEAEAAVKPGDPPLSAGMQIVLVAARAIVDRRKDLEGKVIAAAEGVAA